MTKQHDMIGWAEDLFPIARSLTGPGLRSTLDYFQRLNPEFNILSFPSGMEVFDWSIPKEWEIIDGWIEHESGQRFCEFRKNNLHILGYSTPIDRWLTREEMFEHLYTQKDLPDSIPYVTSYYRERWGFCISENEKNRMPPGQYRVFINSRIFDGELNIGEAILPGQSKEEILFTSYVCLTLHRFDGQ